MKDVHVSLLESSPFFGLAFRSILRQLQFSVKTCDSTNIPHKPVKGVHVILFDVVTFPGSLAELEDCVKRCCRVAPVLLIARNDRIEQIVAGLKAGAVGFIKQVAELPELRKAIVAVAAGGIFCDKRIFQEVMKYLPLLSGASPPALTQREQEVLQFLSLGQTNKEIARRLTLSEQSIKVYVSNLLRKTGTSNRSALGFYAITRGLATAKS